MSQKNLSILIIGIAGGLAQITTKLLQQTHPDCTIYGIDSRPIKGIEENERLKLLQIRFTRGKFENLFRDIHFDYVIHLARVSHTNQNALKKRLDLNLIGTKTILDLCLKHKIKKTIILSTFHVYGAYSDNPIFIEEEAQLKATLKHPELRDVVEMDQICQNYLWQHQDSLQMVIFRPCNIIGANILNSMTKFLLNPFGFHPLDYNPMFQFIHEFDMAKIMVKSLDLPSGIYNVAPDDYISLKEARKIIHGKSRALPICLLGITNRLIRHFGFSVPDYLIDYLKFSCLISNAKIKKALGPDFIQSPTKDALKLLKLAS